MAPGPADPAGDRAGRPRAKAGAVICREGALRSTKQASPAEMGRVSDSLLTTVQVAACDLNSEVQEQGRGTSAVLMASATRAYLPAAFAFFAIMAAATFERVSRFNTPQTTECGVSGAASARPLQRFWQARRGPSRGADVGQVAAQMWAGPGASCDTPGSGVSSE